VLAVLAAAVTVGLMANWPSEEPKGTSMISVAPGGVIALSDVPESLQGLYLGAADHPETFEATPCFCGCSEMLGHRHLLDCFVRADGSGWEAHAAGCGVCLGEAEQVLSLLGDGVPQSEIVAAVIDQWSDPYRIGG